MVEEMSRHTTRDPDDMPALWPVYVFFFIVGISWWAFCLYWGGQNKIIVGEKDSADDCTPVLILIGDDALEGCY